MAEENTAVSEQQSGEAPTGGGRRKMVILGGLMLGVMLAEGLVVFILVKSFAAPPPAAAEASDAAGLAHGEGHKEPQEVEVEIGKFHVQNEKSQRLIAYDFEVYVLVSDKNVDKLKDTLTRKAATIRDHVARIVRSTDPQRFAEPDFTTLRELLKHELGQIVGDQEVILQVLIPAVTRVTED